MANVVDRDGARKADLAAIHIAKAALGWDDDQYRDILFAVCRVRSSAQLDFAGRKRFLAHLRACGWADGRKGRAVAGSGASRPVRKALTPVQRKMWSLWQQLADAGLIENRRMPGLMAWISEHQVGIDRLEWLSTEQETFVIESLKAWLQSRGLEVT